NSRQVECVMNELRSGALRLRRTVAQRKTPARINVQLGADADDGGAKVAFERCHRNRKTIVDHLTSALRQVVVGEKSAHSARSSSLGHGDPALHSAWGAALPNCRDTLPAFLAGIGSRSSRTQCLEIHAVSLQFVYDAAADVLASRLKIPVCSLVNYFRQ